MIIKRNKESGMFDGKMIDLGSKEINDDTFREIESTTDAVGIRTRSHSYHSVKHCIGLGVKYFELVRNRPLSYGVYHGWDASTGPLLTLFNEYNIQYKVITNYDPKITKEGINAMASELLHRGAKNWKIISLDPVPLDERWKEEFDSLEIEVLS